MENVCRPTSLLTGGGMQLVDRVLGMKLVIADILLKMEKIEDNTVRVAYCEPPGDQKICS